MRNITVSRIIRQVRFCCHIMFLHLWWWATVCLSPINKDSWNLMFYDPSCCSKRILILKHDLPNNSAVYDWWPQLHMKQQARAPCSLISLSCHSACCERSITEQWYHAIDSVSTIVGETASGAWSMGPPIHHSTIGWGYRAKPFPNGPNYPLYPLLSTGYALEEWNMPALSTSEKKNLFHSSICGSIGTMGLQTSIFPPCDIPNIFTITSAVLRDAFFGNSQSRFSFPANGSRSEIVCIRSTIWQWCDVSNKCFWSMPYNAWVSSICWVPSLLFNDCSVTGIFILGWFFLLVWGAAADPTARLSVLCPCDTVFSPTSLLLWCSVLLLLLPNARRPSGLSWPLGLSSLKVQDSIFPSNVWLRMIAGTNLLQPLL